MQTKKWGSQRANQTRAEGSGYTTQKVEVPEWRLFGFKLIEARTEEERMWTHLSTDRGDVVPDEMNATREFTFRCGLIKALNIVSSATASMVLYLDGYENLRLSMNQTRFVVGDDDDGRLAEGPIAEIHYKGYGPRYGTLRQYEIVKVLLIFRDRAQLEETVVATTVVADPATKVVEKRIPVQTGGSSGTSSVWPFAAGLLLGVALDSD